MTQQTAIVRAEHIEQAILLLRGQKVMLDRDLAAIYGVETKNLNKTVRRNVDRFPDDFMFQLTRQEVANLKFQFGTSSSTHGGRRKPVTAFTEQGVSMLSSVLNSRRAVQVNIVIMRAFVRLRETLYLHKDLAAKFAELERKVEGHDENIGALFEAIRQLMPPARTGAQGAWLSCQGRPRGLSRQTKDRPSMTAEERQEITDKRSREWLLLRGTQDLTDE